MPSSRTCCPGNYLPSLLSLDVAFHILWVDVVVHCCLGSQKGVEGEHLSWFHCLLNILEILFRRKMMGASGREEVFSPPLPTQVPSSLCFRCVPSNLRSLCLRNKRPWVRPGVFPLREDVIKIIKTKRKEEKESSLTGRWGQARWGSCPAWLPCQCQGSREAG